MADDLKSLIASRLTTREEERAEAKRQAVFAAKNKQKREALNARLDRLFDKQRARFFKRFRELGYKEIFGALIWKSPYTKAVYQWADLVIMLGAVGDPVVIGIILETADKQLQIEIEEMGNE